MRWRDACREPYRLFFPLGVACGCLGVGHWLLYALHVAASSSAFFHAAVQIQAYLFCFIAGFLMTALPRFTSMAPASTLELVSLLAGVAVQLVAMSLGWWVAADGCLIVLLALLLMFVGRRATARRDNAAAPPTEFVWIPFAALFGIAGTLLLMGGRLEWLPSWAPAIGRPMAQQGFVLGIVLGVGGFMGPRLMGTRTLLVTPPVVTPGQTVRIRAQRMWLHAAAAVALAATFWLEGRGAVRSAYLLRAAVVTAELAWTTQFYRAPTVTDLYVRWVWLSLWLTAAGVWAAGAWPQHRVTCLHLQFIGGFSLMTFAVGTMVVMSHAGEGPAVRRPLPILWLVGIGTLAAMTARVAADLFPSRYFLLLGTAAVCWLTAGMGWLLFVLPQVARVPAPGTFERLHEAAKRQMMSR